VPRLGTDNSELLVTGQARYVADIAPDDCVDVCFVRSPVPHAVIRSIDLGTSQAASAAELGLQPLTLEARGLVATLWHPLPANRVRYVGEPVAMAWGADRYEAEDVAEAVSVDYALLGAGTPIHDAAPDGVLFSRSFDSGDVDEAMATRSWSSSEHSRPPANRPYRSRVEGSWPITTRLRASRLYGPRRSSRTW
jgi:CO/xanthine dehydrogenase Mo-binding subunit